jgi:multidrug efflux pump subunit AcrB
LTNILKFFLSNGRLNYTLLVFIAFLGLFSYMQMPKDVFPPVKLDKVIVAGGYAGSSVDILDKMAVTKLEDELRSLSGVSKMESSIKNSQFTITLTLDKGTDIEDTLNDTKDIISNVKRYFPSDMDEPTAKVAELNIPLIAVVVSSDIENMDNLIRIGKEIKRELSKVEGVSNVNLYSENDRVLEINIDTKKVEMYGINKSLLIAELRKFAYIYPAGKIDESGNHFFISTINGNRTQNEILNSRILIGEKSFLLKDVAEITTKYKENDIITRFNGERNIEMGIFKNETGDAIALAENVKKRILQINEKYPTIKIDTYNDASKIVRNRLNTVMSNIFLGIILVGLTVWILINGRLAFVVTIGIPTSLLIGAFVIYVLGFAINIITLLGTLLILGVLVDDAVIVAENIQRHIQMGEDKFHSALVGTKEVLVPVLASSLTTVFAFYPMFVLTGEMGEFLKMIPVAVISLVFASLVESFLFLPIHSYHLFNNKVEELNWSPFNRIYKKVLSFIVAKSKIFVPLFLVIIPVLTIMVFGTMKYQLFPEFDSDKMFIRGSFSVHHTVEEISEKLKPVEKTLLEAKRELQIKSISLLAGYKNTTLGGVEIKPNVFEFFIELESRKPQNFIDEYITPLFSLKEDTSEKIRDLDVAIIVDEVKKRLDTLEIDGLEELLIIRDKPAVAKYDVEILVNTTDADKLKNSLDLLTEKLSKIDGIIMFGNDAKDGIPELKLKPNEFGEMLGFTEGYLAQSLAPFFLEVEQGRGLGNEGIVQVITKERDISNLELLKNFQISTPDGSKMVALKDVAEFTRKDAFDSIFKDGGVSVKTVFANVNNGVITAVEVINILQPIIDQLEKEDVSISLKGEQEQNQRLKKELGTALIIAIFLIFITLLIMFNSFKNTLIVLSVIPLSVLGAVLGHKILGANFTMPSVIGILGLAGVVINNGVVMLDFIRGAKNFEDVLERATLRLRPIMITSITTFIGLSTLIFFATGQAVILQPIAISLGFGLLWGTILNLIYLPALFAVLNRKKFGI